MINKNTVLVLGAGASCHLGFPLGRPLINEIYRFVFAKSEGFYKRNEALNPARDKKENSVLLARFLELSGYKNENGEYYTAEDVKQFAEVLHKAQPPSIDTFLARQPKYKLLGKICIIFCLSKYEDKDGWLYKPSKYPSRLINKNEFPSFGWYQHLWKKMLEDVGSLEELKKNKLTIITFNYDRSLEYYLMEAIQNMFGAPEIDAAEVFKNIKVKHVYGKLGKFYWEKNYLESNENVTAKECMMETQPFTPWEIGVFFRLMGDVGEYGMDSRDFDPGRTVLTEDARKEIVSRFQFAVDEIKTYYENIEKDKMGEYRVDLQEATRIYFLGFGYDEQNLESIGLTQTRSVSLNEHVHIWGTAYKMTHQEKERYAGRLKPFVVNPNNVHLYEEWSHMVKEEDLIIASFFRAVCDLE